MHGAVWSGAEIREDFPVTRRKGQGSRLGKELKCRLVKVKNVTRKGGWKVFVSYQRCDEALT